MYIGRGFISFHTGNMGSVSQRTVRLLSSNFENDPTPVRVKPGPTGWTRAGAEQQTFFFEITNFES